MVSGTCATALLLPTLLPSWRPLDYEQHGRPQLGALRGATETVQRSQGSGYSQQRPHCTGHRVSEVQGFMATMRIFTLRLLRVQARMCVDLRGCVFGYAHVFACMPHMFCGCTSMSVHCMYMHVCAFAFMCVCEHHLCGHACACVCVLHSGRIYRCACAVVQMYMHVSTYVCACIGVHIVHVVYSRVWVHICGTHVNTHIRDKICCTQVAISPRHTVFPSSCTN